MESADSDVVSVCGYCYCSVPIGAVDLRFYSGESAEYLRVREPKGIVGAATDNSRLRFDSFQKRNGAGMKAAMMRGKKNIAGEIKIGLDEAEFGNACNVSR